MGELFIPGKPKVMKYKLNSKLVEEIEKIEGKYDKLSNWWTIKCSLLIRKHLMCQFSEANHSDIKKRFKAFQEKRIKHSKDQVNE